MNGPTERKDDAKLYMTEITDDNRADLAWLAIAQMVDGRACCFCGYTWSSRADVLLRDPIAASAGAKDIACKACWDAGKRL